jgi:hypothetical protein
MLAAEHPTSGAPCAFASASHAAMSMPASAIPATPWRPAVETVGSLRSSSNGERVAFQERAPFATSSVTGLSASGV